MKHIRIRQAVDQLFVEVLEFTEGVLQAFDYIRLQ